MQTCEASGLPDGAERARLVDDAAALADIFAGLMRARHLRLRFDVVTTNACRKFHIDAVTARLICTYRGTGETRLVLVLDPVSDLDDACELA